MYLNVSALSTFTTGNKKLILQDVPSYKEHNVVVSIVIRDLVWAIDGCVGDRWHSYRVRLKVKPKNMISLGLRLRKFTKSRSHTFNVEYKTNTDSRRFSGVVFQAADACEMMLLAVLSPVVRCEWGLSQAQVALITTVSCQLTDTWTGLSVNRPTH